MKRDECGLRKRIRASTPFRVDCGVSEDESAEISNKHRFMRSAGRTRDTFKGESPAPTRGKVRRLVGFHLVEMFDVLRGGPLTVDRRVAIIIAVKLAAPELSQIAFADRLRAFYAERSRAGRPAIHQYEPHVAPPSAKQYTAARTDGSFHRDYPYSAQPSEVEQERTFRLLCVLRKSCR